MAQELYELPEGWEWKELQEVSNKLTDGTHHSPKEQFQENGKDRYLYLTSKNVKNNGLKMEKLSWISESIHNEIYARCNPEYLDQLITKDGAMTGACCLNSLREPFSLLSSVALIKIKRDILSPYFLNLFLQSPAGQEAMLGDISGAAITRTNLKKLKIIQMPLPPLAEQERIVGMLGALFSRIDQAIAQLKHTQSQTKALFASASSNYFESQKDWKSYTLKELIDKGWITSHLDGNHGSNYPKKAEFVDAGIPYISANCIDNGSIDVSKSKFLTTERASKLRKGIAKNLDVIFAHNATVGPVALLETNEEKIILSTSLTYYRCNPSHISPQYLVQFMRSGVFVKQYTAVMGQSTRNQVPITKQRDFVFIIPPVKEQQNVATHLDALSTRTKALEAATAEQLTRLTALKSSLLDTAFKGKL